MRNISISKHMIPAFLTMVFLTILFAIHGLAPFGDRSLANYDANVQYLDLYGYFKECLMGKNNLVFSLCSQLGDNMVPTVSYYLLSPFNFLLLFFEKENFHIFFDLVAALKISLSAAALSFFLDERFEGRLKDSGRIALCLSYALMQFNLQQVCNIMWLDAIYMLPLMILGVYRCVKNGRISLLLAVSTGYALLTNWYAGAMDCLFAGAWFFLELAIAICDKKGRKLRSVFGYAASSALGVMVSAIVFLPTVTTMLNSASTDELMEDSFLGFRANPLTLIASNTFGATSSSSWVTIFCGTLPLVCAIGFFAISKIPIRKKIVGGVLCAFVFLMYFWNPLYLLFSLLKPVGSFFCRFSYMGSFAMIFLAACFLCAFSYENDGRFMVLFVGIYVVVYVATHRLYHLWSREQVVYTTVGILISLAAVLSTSYLREMRELEPRRLAVICSAFLVIPVSGEQFYNLGLIVEERAISNVREYHSYVKDQEQLLADLKEHDSTDYRITETSNRKRGPRKLTSSYDEPLMYNYWSATSYVSSVDRRGLEVMNTLGYRTDDERKSIINTSVIPTDSLLGIKYILSAFPVRGLKKIEGIEAKNGKSVYENPYALPMMFTFSGPDELHFEDVPSGNPFLAVNMVYSHLLGKKVNVFEKVDYTTSSKGKKIIYTVPVDSAHSPLYGNLPWNEKIKSKLTVNDNYKTGYSCFTSPSVFDIPFENGVKNASVAHKTKTPGNFPDAQFFSVNMKTLAKATDALKAGAVTEQEIDHGKIRALVNIDHPGRLFISIPNIPGWKVYVNGDAVTPEILEFNSVMGRLFAIPLSKGTSKVTMVYRCPYAGRALMITIIGCLGILVCLFSRRYRRKKDEDGDISMSLFHFFNLMGIGGGK